DRTLLSNGQWLVQFDGVPGTTRDEQTQYVQGVLHDAALDPVGRAGAAAPGQHAYTVVEHTGSNGLLLLQTAPDPDQRTVQYDLSGLPGFQYTAEYDPDDVDELAGLFQIGPVFEEEEAEDMFSWPLDVNATGDSSGLTVGPSPSIVQGVNGFDGIHTTQRFCGCSPPDTIGAAGPSSFIETVNTSLRIYQKNGTPVTSITSFASFFSPLGGTLSFSDPVIVYNEFTGRFFIGLLDFNTSSQSRLDVAISKSSNPTTLTTADWNFFRYNLDDPSAGFDFGDYPKVGYDADGYVISVNQFKNASFFDHSA